MKVIFLDIDGVVNDYLTIDSINEMNVLVLKKIIDKTGARIVVTSSNKYQFQRKNSPFSVVEETPMYKKYIKKLNELGIDIFDFTPYSIDENRELEIINYLNSHPEIDQYLILDDDHIIEKCRNHEIFLDLQSGLREKHILPAINILNGRLAFYHDYENLNETPEERCIRMNEIADALEKIKSDNDEEER